MVTNTDVANSFLQNTAVLPPKLLDSDASNGFVLKAPNTSTTKAPILSRFMRAHAYIKKKRWEFWYAYLHDISIKACKTWIKNRHVDILKTWIKFFLQKYMHSLGNQSTQL